jgi:hypothetical protein
MAFRLLAAVLPSPSRAALQQQLPRLPRTYLAEAHGCGGIVEGLRHFGFGDLLA